MFKSFRPEPLSPKRTMKNNLLPPSAVRHTSLSPGRLDNSQNLIHSKDAEGISNMKIFNEANDEGMPMPNWREHIPYSPIASPSVLEMVHSATLKPDDLPSSTVQNTFFNKRNKKRLFSAKRGSVINNSPIRDSSKGITSKYKFKPILIFLIK